MTTEEQPAPPVDDPVRRAIEHRRDTEDRARAEVLRDQILAAALEEGSPPSASTTRYPSHRSWRRRGLAAAAAVGIVLAGAAVWSVLDDAPTATARSVLLDAAEATRTGSTARYEIRAPFEISGPAGTSFASYDFGCVLDVDHVAGGSIGRCESRRVGGAPLFEFLEGDYDVLILENVTYERDDPGEPWVANAFGLGGTQFSALWAFLDPVSAIELLASEDADVDDGRVESISGSSLRSVTTVVRVPLESVFGTSILDAQVTAVIDDDDQVLQLSAQGAAVTDEPITSTWEVDIRIDRVAVDIALDLPDEPEGPIEES